MHNQHDQIDHQQSSSEAVNEQAPSNQHDRSPPDGQQAVPGAGLLPWGGALLSPEPIQALPRGRGPLLCGGAGARAQGMMRSHTVVAGSIGAPTNCCHLFAATIVVPVVGCSLPLLILLVGACCCYLDVVDLTALIPWLVLLLLLLFKLMLLLS